MTALDEVLESYRDMFGVKTERANEIHRLACEEVARLREAAQHLRALDKVPVRLGDACPKCGGCDVQCAECLAALCQ